MKKSLILLAMMLGSFALTMFLSRHEDADPGIWVAVFVMMAVIYIPFGISSIGNFIAERPRKVFWTGIGLAVGGIAVLFLLISGSAFYGIPKGITGTDATSLGAMYIFMIGIALTVLPRSLVAARRFELAKQKPTSEQLRRAEFSGIEEGWNATVLTVRNLYPFVRVVGPWIILLWVIPFIGLHVAAYANGITPSIFSNSQVKADVPTELFGEGLPLLLAATLSFPTALVAWHRYVLENQFPRFGIALPDIAALRYLWRLWIAIFLFGTLTKLAVSNAPDLARILGLTDNGIVADILFWAAFCAWVFLGSSYALVFPAVAIGNRDYLGSDSLLTSKRLGIAFRFGFVISLLPFGILSWVIDDILERVGVAGPALSLSPSSYLLRLLPITAIFLALISCANYLSHVYRTRRLDSSTRGATAAGVAETEFSQ